MDGYTVPADVTKVPLFPGVSSSDGDTASSLVIHGYLEQNGRLHSGKLALVNGICVVSFHQLQAQWVSRTWLSNSSE